MTDLSIAQDPFATDYELSRLPRIAPTPRQPAEPIDYRIGLAKQFNCEPHEVDAIMQKRREFEGWLRERIEYRGRDGL